MRWSCDTPGEILSHQWPSLAPNGFSRATQRGHYPDEPNKQNQDSCLAIPQLGEFKDISFFAVFDGHGKDGHLCSRYARDHVLNSPPSRSC